MPGEGETREEVSKKIGIEEEEVVLTLDKPRRGSELMTALKGAIPPSTEPGVQFVYFAKNEKEFRTGEEKDLFRVGVQVQRKGRALPLLPSKWQVAGDTCIFLRPSDINEPDIYPDKEYSQARLVIDEVVLFADMPGPYPQTDPKVKELFSQIANSLGEKLGKQTSP